MKTRIVITSIFLLLSITITAQEQKPKGKIPWYIENRTPIPEKYQDSLFIPVGNPLYTLLKTAKMVDGYPSLYLQERILQQNNDTSCTWKALNLLRPDLLEKYDIPTWAVTYPKEDDLVEYFGDFANVVPKVIKIHKDDGTYCTHCGGYITIRNIIHK